MYEAVISCERTVFFSHKNNNKLRNLSNSSLDCSAEGVTVEKLFCQRGVMPAGSSTRQMSQFCRTEGPLSVAGSTESREGVNLDCILKGRSLSAVRYAEPHLQVHLQWEEGFRWRNQLRFNWDLSYNNRFVGVVWKKVWRLILVLYFHNDLTYNYRNFDLQGGYFLLYW